MRLAKEIICRYFREGFDTDDAAAIVQLASRLELDAEAVRTGMNDPEIKALARRHGEGAVSRGVFGSPWVFIDGESFWGNDRLAMAGLWLEKGGW